jgi:hypothetical protein
MHRQPRTCNPGIAPKKAMVPSLGVPDPQPPLPAIPQKLTLAALAPRVSFDTERLE